MNDREKIYEFSAGKVCFWLEQESSIMLKAIDKKYGDPVELEADEAREIAKIFLKLSDYIDSH